MKYHYFFFLILAYSYYEKNMAVYFDDFIQFFSSIILTCMLCKIWKIRQLYEDLQSSLKIASFVTFTT